ncbi:Ribonuclease H-like protein [Purpureocillium lavendulum]|uniref:Ribonuclease H-like protein n=1 Tax=Purpureocillium lavendulum TaxID=1247861 RepID=A0AB34FAJ7_9HYPO|nr:hypothetical protein O9K51_11487 [Purpureocillium lavendulum]KAJ6436133.1 hypothetical protein O9K51_11358 [Purpureocillium lavendulum]KAJ6436467.1 Ribonuclease H-like protein [Purpureocillium lavendulum]
MSSTYFSLKAASSAPEHLATGYYWDEVEEIHREEQHMTVVEISGAGGTISTAADYARWIKCLVHQTARFSAAVHGDMRAPRILCGKPSMGKDIAMDGLGW